MQGPGDERKQMITERAYELFLARGGEHGLHEDDWAQAERELMAAGRIAPDPAAPVEIEDAGEASCCRPACRSTALQPSPPVPAHSEAW